MIDHQAVKLEPDSVVIDPLCEADEETATVAVIDENPFRALPRKQT